MKKVIVSLLMISVLGLTGCDKVVNEYEKDDIGIVMDKQYEKAEQWTQPMPCGKFLIPITHYESAKYNVIIKFKDKEETINNKELYNNVELYNEVPITVTYFIYESGKQKFVFDIR